MISHNKPSFNEDELLASKRVLESGYVAQGPEVESFENEFCEYVGLPQGHAVCVSSGTAALYLALWSLEASGKKVAFPAYVCSALRHAVNMANGKEILIDLDNSNSPNISVSSIQLTEASIGIIPHMYGIPEKINSNKSLPIIEDCCHALGSKIDGAHVGLKGEISIFSFYATKLITSGGQGGMIASKNKGYIDKIKDYRDFDCRRDSNKRFNFQITDLQAAIGRVQLKKYDEFLNKRRSIYNTYKDLGLPLLGENIKPEEHTPYRAILLNNNVNKIIEYLQSKNVKVINPLEDWELLGKGQDFKNSLELTKNTISLPIYPALEDEELKHIVKVIREEINLFKGE